MSEQQSDGRVASGAVELISLPWPLVPTRPLVLVPVGSVEQHGPHLPLDTDTVIAAAVAASAAEDLDAIDDRAVLVAPAMNYGASGEHQAFPGTVSVGESGLHTMIVEIMRSLSQWAGAVVFVNGHGGNLSALSRAVLQMRGEGHQVAWAPCSVPGGDAHAGRTETSLMLHLAPARVRTDAIAPGVTSPLHEMLPGLRQHGVRSVSPTGILGDPTGSTATEGEELFRSMVETVHQRLRAGRVDGHGCLVTTGALGSR